MLANAATRSILEGSDFGDNVLAALPDVIAQTVFDLAKFGVAGGARGGLSTAQADDGSITVIGSTRSTNGAVSENPNDRIERLLGQIAPSGASLEMTDHVYAMTEAGVSDRDIVAFYDQGLDRWPQAVIAEFERQNAQRASAIATSPPGNVRAFVGVEASSGRSENAQRREVGFSSGSDEIPGGEATGSGAEVSQFFTDHSGKASFARAMYEVPSAGNPKGYYLFGDPNGQGYDPVARGKWLADAVILNNNPTQMKIITRNLSVLKDQPIDQTGYNAMYERLDDHQDYVRYVQSQNIDKPLGYFFFGTMGLAAGGAYLAPLAGTMLSGGGLTGGQLIGSAYTIDQSQSILGGFLDLSFEAKPTLGGSSLYRFSNGHVGEGTYALLGLAPAAKYGALYGINRFGPGAAESAGGARQILLNRVREAGSLSEAKGIVYGTRQMERIGYSLEDVSLGYGGNHGLDLVFGNGSNYAILEAKHAGGLNRLMTYGGLRQGSSAYNASRLQGYLRYGDGTNDAFANMLLAESKAGRLESFTSSYRAGKLQQLPIGWPDPAVPAVVR